MIKQIKAMAPQRDEYGFWTHPDFFEPADGREYGAPGELEAWLDTNRVAGHLEALEAADGDISNWILTPPTDEGWFIGSIHDTEDGPVCYWLRPVEGEPTALADLISRCHVEALKLELLRLHRECTKAAHAYFCACDLGEERVVAGEIYQQIRLATRRGGY